MSFIYISDQTKDDSKNDSNEEDAVWAYSWHAADGRDTFFAMGEEYSQQLPSKYYIHGPSVTKSYLIQPD